MLAGMQDGSHAPSAGLDAYAPAEMAARVRDAGVGGGLLVGAVYWFIYLRRAR
jgi:hypothetical protein